MSTQPRMLGLVGAVAVTLALVGCVQAQPTGPGAPPELSQQAFELIARSGSYYVDNGVLSSAEASLTSRCMASHGFAYPTREATPTRDQEWRPVLEERRLYGYGLTAPEPTQASAADRYVRGLPPTERERYRRALLGDPSQLAALNLPGGKVSFPTGGCLAESQRRIYGSPEQAARIFYLPQQAYVGAYVQLRDTPPYHAALERWRACMSRAGHAYPSPGDARARLAAELPGLDRTVARRREIVVALADAACAEETHLANVVESLLRAVVVTLPAPTLTALNEVATAHTTALRTARSVEIGGAVAGG